MNTLTPDDHVPQIAALRARVAELEAQAKGHADECDVGIKLRDSVADELGLTLRALRCSRARVAELEAGLLYIRERVAEAENYLLDRAATHAVKGKT